MAGERRSRRSGSHATGALADLKVAARRYRALVDSNVVGIAISENERGVIEANDCFLEMVGYTREELEAGVVNLEKMTPPEWQPATEQAKAQLLEQAEAIRPFEKEYVRKDGSRLPVLAGGALLERSPPRFLGLFVDLSVHKQVEEELNRFFGIALEGLCIAGLDGYFRRINPSFERLLGYTLEELCAEPFVSFVHPDDRAATLAEVEKLSQGIDVISFENRYRGKDGSYRWLRWNSTAVPELGLIYAAARDVTTERRQQQQLRESQERLELAQLAGGVGVFDWDISMGAIVWTEQLERIFGMPPGSFGGNYALWRDRVHPDDVLRVEAEVQQALDEDDAWVSEYRIVQPGGAVRWIGVRGRPFRRDGTPVRFVGVNVDITERKQAEETRQETQALLDALIETTPVGRAVYDQELRTLLLNERLARTYGVSAADCLGRRPSECLPSLGAEIEGWVGQVLKTGEPLLDFEIEQRRADGALMHTLHSYWPVRREDGRLLGVGVVVEDISERKQLESTLEEAREETERASRAKSEFLSQMSHELRTPLNAVLGFAQLLQLLEELPPGGVESVERILSAGEHLLALINELLDIEQIESGRLTTSPEPVDVRQLVAETLELMAPLASQRETDLVNAVPHDPAWHVQADQPRLKQVLLNLLANAVKYGPDHNVVRVIAEPAGESALRIGVRDAGPGISDADQERVFEPFERLVRDTEGTGLGLTLCKGLVEAMDGAIGLESTLGEGCLFWVELPLVESPIETLEADGGEKLVGEPPPAATASRTVLYVEDNLSNVRLIEAVLARRPAVRLLSAMQGQLGLELAAGKHPDLILLDLHLPDIPGEEVMRRLQADERTSGIPVVVVSADATVRQIKRLLAAGASDYLTKPLDVKRLLEIIDGLGGG